MSVKSRCITVWYLLLPLFLLVSPLKASFKHATPLKSLRDFAKHNGEYPCANGLLKDPILLRALRQTLAGDYSSYREFLGFAGCGFIQPQKQFYWVDMSQEHVGGYSSILIVDSQTGKLYLFWLKSGVGEKDWKIYGERPLPPEIGSIIEDDMNESWGHVAHFQMEGEQLNIEMNKNPHLP